MKKTPQEAFASSFSALVRQSTEVPFSKRETEHEVKEVSEGTKGGRSAVCTDRWRRTAGRERPLVKGDIKVQV